MKSVDCSPGVPAKRVHGSMTHSTLCRRSRAASCLPLVRLEHHAAMGHRHPVAVDRVEMCVEAPVTPKLRIEVADELVPVEVEIDPVAIAAPFGAAEHVAVEAPCLLDIPDLQRHMEGRERHVGTWSRAPLPVHSPIVYDRAHASSPRLQLDRGVPGGYHPIRPGARARPPGPRRRCRPRCCATGCTGSCSWARSARAIRSPPRRSARCCAARSK